MLTIVIEVGTLNTKAGFAGQSLPRIITESYLVQTPYPHPQQFEEEELFARQEPRQFTHNIDLSRKDLQIQDIFQKVWQQPQLKLGLNNLNIKNQPFCKFITNIINQLKEGHLGQCQVMIVESSNFKGHVVPLIRNTLCQYLLDQFNLSSVHFFKSAVANCFSQGSPSAILVDSGHNLTHVARVVDGYQEVCQTFNFGGNIISHQLDKYLQKKNWLPSFSYSRCLSVNNVSDLIKARELKDLKQSLFIERSDIEGEREVTVELPDKQTIKIDKADILEPFTQFSEYQKDNPLLFPASYQGLSRTVVNLMQQTKLKYSHSISQLIFTGGNFLYKDILDRSQQQILNSSTARGLPDPQFLSNQNKLMSAWLGGSITSNLSSFSHHWISNKEWKQNGNSIISKKCP